MLILIRYKDLPFYVVSEPSAGQCSEPLSPFPGQRQCPARLPCNDPALPHVMIEHGLRQGAGQMITPLRPVQASISVAPTARRLHTQIRQPTMSRVSQHQPVRLVAQKAATQQALEM